jgi:hypothetical protein
MTTLAKSARAASPVVDYHVNELFDEMFGAMVVHYLWKKIVAVARWHHKRGATQGSLVAGGRKEA